VLKKLQLWKRPKKKVDVCKYEVLNSFEGGRERDELRLFLALFSSCFRVVFLVE
jgi:hypothetical protein